MTVFSLHISATLHLTIFGIWSNNIQSVQYVICVMIVRWLWNIGLAIRYTMWIVAYLAPFCVLTVKRHCLPLMRLPRVAGGAPAVNHKATAIDQCHRYGRHQAACREPAGSYDKTTRTVICFEHKTQYILIRAPYTRIVVFWHISNISPMISQSQISWNTPTFYIATIFVKYCYTRSWLL